MPKGKKGFQKGHKFFPGGEKNWFKKGEPSKGVVFKKGDVPWTKGLPKEKHPWWGKKHSPETIEKMKKVVHPKGYKLSEETRQKMRDATRKKESESSSWKGDKVGYFGVHAWVVRKKGKAKKCVDCGTLEGKIEWSNANHKYKRVLKDYQAPCVKCHRKHDKAIKT